jgi:dinuclear metal center YbgI/SA1388 family protein
MTGRSVPLADVTAWLDGFLRIGEIPDYPNALNGLEVENGGRVARVVAAVDTSLATIEQAVAGAGPALLLTHHGLFWDGNLPVTGRRYRRLRALLAADAALYAAHIPLDLHPEVGNNAVLARMLGMSVDGWFGNFKGVPIGVHGPLVIEREALADRLTSLLGGRTHLIAGGPARTRHIGIVTGAAGGMLAEAKAAGCDTFITGEAAHHLHFDATEWGVNVFLAGHYATETVGVRALAERVAGEFSLPWEFHDHPTGL